MFRIKADASRDIIKYFLDKWLDILPTYPLPNPDHRKKARFRGNASDLKDAQFIYEAHHNGKSFPQIARERSKTQGSPSYNPKLKAEYEKVKRLYKRIKEIKENE